MRLITLGDSVTNGHWNWPTPLSRKLNCELINLAIPASQNSLQIQIMQDWLLNNELDSTDIIIWQICQSWKPLVRINLDYLEDINSLDKERDNKYPHYTLTNFMNKFDNKNRIDLLDLSPALSQFIKLERPRDRPQTLQDLLFMFTMVKKLCSNLLIITGKKTFIPNPADWETMKILLQERNIDYLNESIVDWCEENSLELLDATHPSERASHIFSMHIIYPKLKGLGWV